MKNAAAEYRMNGKRYGFTLEAESLADAERRLAAIRLTGKVSGWPCYQVRTNAVTLPFAAAGAAMFCFVRNLFGRVM